MKYEDVNKIAKWSDDLDGVFTMSDLKVLFGESSEAALYKKLRSLTEEGLLLKVCRGIYVSPGTSLEVISNRINPDSYISAGTVLARNMLIGSVPARKVQAVKIGRPRKYDFKMGTIEHLSIAPELFFGFDSCNDFQDTQCRCSSDKTGNKSAFSTSAGKTDPLSRIKYATSEKAFLDVCYFYYKGRRFSFDPGSDVDLNALDTRLIEQYLQKYNKRFISFFRGLWG